MQSELYFPNYEYSPFYADIKLSFKRVEEKNNYNDNTWTIQKYIDLCEKRVGENGLYAGALRSCGAGRCCRR